MPAKRPLSIYTYLSWAFIVTCAVHAAGQTTRSAPGLTGVQPFSASLPSDRGASSHKKWFPAGGLPISAATNSPEYPNPILAGFYPDPSICRVGSEYYLVNSSFAYFPGLPIFHSRDLVNWRQIGSAMDRPQQFDLAGAGVSRGLFAPALRFHGGNYYITCTFVDKLGNFVITAKDPHGPWSDPVALPAVNGIDPSLFFDEDDKAYIIYNSIAPDDKPLYEGHRTIRIMSFDAEKLQTVGEESILINGGSDLAKKPVWIEGPHLFKKDGFYYLIAAEGGTEYNHSEVVFRSAGLAGPFTPGDNNPILTQRQLAHSRPSPITCTGHADLVQTPAGDWYAVFLGCRPYAADHYNTGRETFMAPVEWKNGWPVIVQAGSVVQDHYPVPFPKTTKSISNPYNGHLPFMENFSGSMFDRSLVFLRTPREKWADLSERKGFLSMRLLPQTCSGKENPAFIGHRQQQSEGSASTALDFRPVAENEKAGLLVFQNETHYYFLCRSISDSRPIVQLYRSLNISPGAAVPHHPTLSSSFAPDPAASQMDMIAFQILDSVPPGRELQLKIVAKGATYAFYYAEKKDKWHLLKDNVDATFLSTRTAGGFVGCMYALYATSLGRPTRSKAYFDWFSCAP
jgi:xylan 1,4-beta-xylosidase